MTKQEKGKYYKEVIKYMIYVDLGLIRITYAFKLKENNEYDCCCKLYTSKSVWMNLIRMKSQSQSIIKLKFRFDKET